MADLPITVYTSTDAVRGAIGLTDNELLDETLVNQGIDDELTVDLDNWLPTHAALFAAGIAGSATDDEKRVVTYIQLYSQWFVSAQILTVMSLTIPQSISDGQNEMRRFQQTDLDALRTAAVGRMAIYRKYLSDEIGAVVLSSPVLVVGGRPTYDPVTNS